MPPITLPPELEWLRPYLPYLAGASTKDTKSALDVQGKGQTNLENFFDLYENPMIAASLGAGFDARTAVPAVAPPDLSRPLFDTYMNGNDPLMQSIADLIEQGLTPTQAYESVYAATEPGGPLENVGVDADRLRPYFKAIDDLFAEKASVGTRASEYQRALAEAEANDPFRQLGMANPTEQYTEDTINRTAYDDALGSEYERQKQQLAKMMADVGSMSQFKEGTIAGRAGSPSARGAGLSRKNSDPGLAQRAVSAVGDEVGSFMGNLFAPFGSFGSNLVAPFRSEGQSSVPQPASAGAAKQPMQILDPKYVLAKRAAERQAGKVAEFEDGDRVARSVRARLATQMGRTPYVDQNADRMATLSLALRSALGQ
jgi:hypothetical protein